MGKRSLNQCRSGKDFAHYATHHPNCVRTAQSGTSHLKAYNQKGEMVVIPVHSEDLGSGLRAKIVKMMILIGFGVFAALILL